MQSVAAAVFWDVTPSGKDVFAFLETCTGIAEIATIVPSGSPRPTGKHVQLSATSPRSATAVLDAVGWFHRTGASHLLWVLSGSVAVTDSGLKRLVDCARDTQAAIVYSDFVEQSADGPPRIHSLVDYQPGSLRDDFDFGQVVLLQRSALETVLPVMKGETVATEFGGWYDLRLRLSEQGSIVHLPEPTYTIFPLKEPVADGGEEHFRYVDPRNREYQIEMEQIATGHLKRIGAFLETPHAPLIEEGTPFAVEASIVIPVRNRCRTVAEAVESALAQDAEFEFNVIVVDNHSDDGTTEILAEIAARNPRLVHLTPTRRDLGIGGCWNEAIYSTACGRFAVQLDSDDLYAGPHVLACIIRTFRETGCAMAIGSYSIVDFDLNPLPPGLVDHREWTDENGHNNALRIAGLGAPRAFHVPTLRTIGFPNVSFGEDYAVGLRMTRTYRIGRIYDSLYWCRRWEDNTDHALSLETSNRYASYKDRLRSIEIAARQARRL